RAVCGSERLVLLIRAEFDDSYGEIGRPAHRRRLQKEFAHLFEVTEGFPSFLLAGAGEEFKFGRGDTDPLIGGDSRNSNGEKDESRPAHRHFDDTGDATSVAFRQAEHAFKNSVNMLELPLEREGL